MGKSIKSDNVDIADTGRRNFIHLATGTVAAFGAGAMAWPLVAHMNLAADRRHQRAIAVDLRKIPEGSEVKYLVNGQPIFVRHRTEDEILQAQSVDLELLVDPQTDDERLVPMPNGALNRKFLVVVGVCSHFGCHLHSDQDEATVKGRYGGWYCPCHGANFDTSGRVRSAPAPSNMSVPPYRYVNEDRLELLYRPKFLPRD